MRSAPPPQHGGHPHPDQSAQHRRRNGDGQVQGRRQPVQAESGERGRKRPDVILTLDADVEHVDLKPDCGRQAGKDQGRRRCEDAGHGAGLHVERRHEREHGQWIFVNREDDRGGDQTAGEDRDNGCGNLQEYQPAARPHGTARPV
jgi:hypothetical protein